MSLTSGDVREFLRDYGEYNILLDNVEFTEDEIEKAMGFAVDRYNLLTPTTNITTDTFPNRWLLLIGTCIHLLQSAAFLQLRNQATYNDGDVERIGIDDKFALYQQLASQLSGDWNTHAQKIKQQKNMEDAYDSLSSGYRYLRTGNRNVS
jgi:hypothetical protein